MALIWLVLTEILAPSGDTSPLEQLGFMNVTTWAESKEEAIDKIQKYLRTFDWQIVGVEEVTAIDETCECTSEVLADMIERTRNNPNAIILGTLHRYKVN